MKILDASISEIAAIMKLDMGYVGEGFKKLVTYIGSRNAVSFDSLVESQTSIIFYGSDIDRIIELYGRQPKGVFRFECEVSKPFGFFDIKITPLSPDPM
jgi:hypothetical protein